VKGWLRIRNPGAEQDRHKLEGFGEVECLRGIEIEAGLTDRVDVESVKPADDEIHQDGLFRQPPVWLPYPPISHRRCTQTPIRNVLVSTW
jgi:hypothetical protein